MILKTFSELKKSSKFFSKSNASERIEILERIKQWILLHQQEIRTALFQDFNKPEFESDISEIMITLSEISHTQKQLKSWMKKSEVKTPLTLMGHSSHIQYEPKGVVLIISPWNYPFQLCLAPLIAALSAGNTVIVKPSELTPQTSNLIEKMILELFSESKLVACVQGDKEITSELLTLDFDHVFFTGSTLVGRIVAEKCSQKLIPYTLELGGKCPVILHPSCDIKDAVCKIHWGKFLNAGQTCVAPDTVIVHESIYEIFKTEFQTLTQQLKNLERAQIINDRNIQRLQKLDPQFSISREPYFIEDFEATEELKNEEIFGPFFILYKYKTIDDIENIIEKNKNPLALYIFSSDKSFNELILSSIPSGDVGINTLATHLANSNLPFGGRGTSGQGKYHGHFGFKEFSHPKSVIEQKFFFFSSKLIQPPYTPFKKWVIRLLLGRS